ncbi:MAG: tRNA (N(6)-L-threonylcarbamoyladenosine(37)-C(2))-methylthiotransferase [archaeon]
MKVHIETFGCSANQADSEIIAGILVKAGYNIVDGSEKADLVIVNSCIVKGKTETHVFKEIEHLRKLGKKFIVSGCLPQTRIYSEKLKDFSVLGVFEISRVAEAVKAVLSGKKISWLGNNKEEKLCFPRLRKNPAIAVVIISSGCVGHCTYCMAKLARGDLFSYSAAAIVQEVKNALEEGCKEIWLTSQDCAAYGLDIKTNFTGLLEKILELDGKFLVRIGMSNPDNILKNLEKLIELYKNPKVFKFLHMPVQSGNDKILKLMDRKYKTADFKKIVTAFRKEIPDISISTDIICGFPSETEEQFNDSLELVKWLKPDVLNLNMFWPRPGTPAAKMRQLKPGIGRERTRIMTDVFDKTVLEKNKNMVGNSADALVDEKGRKGGFVARCIRYKPIIFAGRAKLGDFVKLKITDATRDYLIGKKI